MSQFRQSVIYRIVVIAALIHIPLSVLILAFDANTADRAYALIAGGVASAVLAVHVLARRDQRLLGRLAQELGWLNLRRLHVYTKVFPAYRFVDVFRAAERYWKARGNRTLIDSLHAEDLNSILSGQFYGEQSGKIKPPPMTPREVAWHKEVYFPSDRFWIIRPDETGRPADVSILRMRVQDYTGEAVLEIAAGDSLKAEEVTEQIVRESIEQSIYRNQLLQVSFEPGVRDEFGDVDGGGFQLLFMQRKEVTPGQIILDDDVTRILERNVFDFHRRRDELKRHGVPCKKGLLFYGPPGTGKTYTCQYIYSTLKNVTTLVVTGQSLLHVRTICNLARMLQPSLLVLEDVDLIFSSREVNLYSTALGDLMDELDGFQSEEPVTFLLTTNAIDRLEQAIKDRPGRINQCIYFGPPGAELRERYILRYLDRYDAGGLDLGQVVEDTRGATQAFIKELIYRAVQVAIEDPSRNGETVRLADGDFQTALHEMTRFSEKATGAIMGFKVG